MAWIINHWEFEEVDETWFAASDKWADEMLSLPCKAFRLYGDDGNFYFQGLCTTFESDPFAPMDEYGVDFGCTEVRYWNGENWKRI